MASTQATSRYLRIILLGYTLVAARDRKEQVVRATVQNLELTESLLAQQIDRIVAKRNALKARGVGFWPAAVAMRTRVICLAGPCRLRSLRPCCCRLRRWPDKKFAAQQTVWQRMGTTRASKACTGSGRANR